MTHYVPRVVSVRLPGDVFEALKVHAKVEGRSVSGSIAYLVKEEVASRAAPRAAPKKLTGFLAHMEVPGSIEEWRAARRDASKRLKARSRSTSRKRPAE